MDIVFLIGGLLLLAAMLAMVKGCAALEQKK
jgi:hypothetical protein